MEKYKKRYAKKGFYLNSSSSSNTFTFSKLGFALFSVLSLLFCEILLKATTSEIFFDRSLLYLVLFALSMGFLFYALFSISKNPTVNKVITAVVLFLIGVLFCVQYFCKKTFTFFMSISAIKDGTGDLATGFMDTVWKMILGGWYYIILFMLPFIFFVTIGIKFVETNKTEIKTKLISLGTSVVCYALALVLIYTSSAGMITDKGYYTANYDGIFYADPAASKFGLFQMMRLDLKYLIFGTPEADGDIGEIVIGTNDQTAITPPTTTTQSSGKPLPPPIVYGYNTMDIDFDALLADTTNKDVKELHNYFSSLEGTKKNEFTGMFEGKNLVFVVAEAFSSYIIDPERTPTLYKLANNGFVFNDYYQPAWGNSTSDGEYSALLGLIPKSGVNSMKTGKNNNWYFCLAQQFNKLGCTSRAYHDHTYTYYSRDLTHPNLGFEYKGVGNGLDNLTNGWPRSDLEMIQQTKDEYINDDQFFTYYLTVSGHALYSYMGNRQASKHKEEVAELDYSDTVKAYLACNMEVELALNDLMASLEAAGKLDDTVIVLTADHHPYGLQKGSFDGVDEDYYSELAGRELKDNFDIFKNTLIIYNSGMKEKVVVNEPCYSIDILPTLLNLFGMEYDSRLLVGRDILSDSDPLVIFRDYSWITDKGRYNSQTNTFTPTAGEEVDQAYVKEIAAIVREKVKYSAKILETDYYDKVFG